MRPFVKSVLLASAALFMWLIFVAVVFPTLGELANRHRGEAGLICGWLWGVMVLMHVISAFEDHRQNKRERGCNRLDQINTLHDR